MASSMIIEGTKLLFLGMAVVFSFLTILMFAISSLGHYFAAVSEREMLDEFEGESDTSDSNLQVVCVIAAAVRAYRNMQRAKT